MKITAVEPIAIDSYLFVRIHTDKGIVGLGEAGAWGHREASEAALKKFAAYLVGQDPFQIELHQNVMYRWSYFRGAAIMAAISAIDIALWDIKGKSLGVPVYELLGGKVRNQVRVYVHVKGETIEEQVARCLEAKKQGFTAVGHLNPFLDENRDIPYFKPHARKMAEAVDSVRQYREALGNDVDLCIEIHRRLTPPEAITFGLAIEPFYPFFYEDPIPPDSIDAMAEVAQKIKIPVATGERLIYLSEFQMLMERRAAQYLRPCICVVGGITAGKKIAAMAESHNLDIVPHNPLSPVSTAACLQLAGAIPNLAIQEYPEDQNTPHFKEIFKCNFEQDNGFIIVPDAPGIGIELTPDARQKFPPKPRLVSARRHIDGSVVPQ